MSQAILYDTSVSHFKYSNKSKSSIGCQNDIKDYRQMRSNIFYKITFFIIFIEKIGLEIIDFEYVAFVNKIKTIMFVNISQEVVVV